MNHHLEGLFNAIRKVDGEDLRLAEHISGCGVNIHRGAAESYDSLGRYWELPPHRDETEFLFVNILDYDLDKGGRV
jgi:hypothetical protein